MPTRPKTHRPHGAPTRQQQHRAYDARRKADPALAHARRLRGSGRYTDFRAWFRNRHPLCCDPLGLHTGRVVPMSEVHHIEGVTKQTLCSERDCAPLCTTCHGAISTMERQGQETGCWFEAWRKSVEERE